MALQIDRPRALVLWTLATTVVTIGLVWALVQVRQVLLLIYVSGLLAIGFAPLVRIVEHQRLLPIGKRLPRWLAILVVYLAILGGLAGVLLIVLPPLIQQARAFWAALPDLLQRAQRFLIARGIVTQPVTMGELARQAPSGSDVVGTLLVTAWGVFGGLLGALTVVILTFYFLVDAEDLFRGFLRLFPPPQRPGVRTVSEEVTTKVSAWMRAQMILAGVIGCTTAIGLGLMGVPYFYVLALIAAFGELIPYVGPILGAVPGIAVAAASSAKFGLVVAGFYLVQQQVESNLLVPKLMERQVGLSAAGVLIALLIGAALLGIPGAILAVPTAAIGRVLAQHLLHDGG